MPSMHLQCGQQFGLTPFTVQLFMARVWGRSFGAGEAAFLPLWGEGLELSTLLPFMGFIALSVGSR